MSYNHRMSMVPNTQQQNRGKKKEDDSDAFMRLPEKEIAGCISDIGVPFTVADLQKPNPVQIQMIFELFVEVLMNATRETVDPAMRAAAEEICGEYMDVIPADTRNLMGFYMSLRKLLIECGIEDFSFQDLFKPTTDRLVKIFSYIINFVRFRESQTGVIDEHLNKVENTKVRIESLYMENQDMEARLEEMERNKKAMESVVQEKKRRNEELKQRLLQLKGSQEKVTRRFENAKIKKGEVTAVLEDKTAATIVLRQESAKLRPYTRQSTPALQASLMELSNALNTEKTQIDTLDRRARGLQTSTDTFSVVTSDVESCIKLIEDISTELETEEKENAKITKQRDHLGDEGNKVRDIERREAYNKRQLARWKEKAAKVKENDEENSKIAKERTKQLKELYQKQNAERSEKGKEMEKRRVKTEQIEKKMADLKENIENEIHSAHDEFMAMDSHIRLYITEMEQSI